MHGWRKQCQTIVLILNSYSAYCHPLFWQGSDIIMFGFPYFKWKDLYFLGLKQQVLNRLLPGRFPLIQTVVFSKKHRPFTFLASRNNLHSIQVSPGIYVMTSDRGPNEVMAKKMWMVRARNAPGIVCLTADCNEHLAHLITLQSLKSVDGYLKRHGRPWKLFASVATSSNTFRDLSKSIFEEWSNIHGDESAWNTAKKLWPKCIGGRWNSVHEVLCRMVKVGGKQWFCLFGEDFAEKGT